MARVYGLLYFVGGVIMAVSLALPDDGVDHDQTIAGIAVVCMLFAATFLAVYSRLPIWFFQAATLAGSVLTAIAIHATGSHGGSGYILFYVWVVLVAFLFFDFRVAAAQGLFAVATYVFVVITGDTRLGADYVMALIAVLGLTGVGIGLLRYRLERLALTLATQANTDPVTTIANRRSFESHFDEELTSADQEGSSLSIVICDLDQFKRVNDELGHEEGDRALRLAAETIASSVRSVDIVFRLGGEEFAVLLPETGTLEAYTVAERIRGGIQDTFANYPVPVTVSCGLATRVHPRMNRKDLLRAADAALYDAKRNGRNRTVTHDPAIEGQSFSAKPLK
jgi:diguanylate cyclase (GGDEF)-like protein